MEHKFKVGDKVFIESGANVDSCNGKIGQVSRVDDNHQYQPCIEVALENDPDSRVWCYPEPPRGIQFNVKVIEAYKVTREQLAEIYSIACSTWKPKIEKITNDALGAFNTEGELSEEIVQSMRDAATTEQRPVIDRIFPKPKKMVTKEAVGYVNIYKGGAFGLVRDTKGEAMANARNALVVAHEIRIPYEVEEEC